MQRYKIAIRYQLEMYQSEPTNGCFAIVRAHRLAYVNKLQRAIDRQFIGTMPNNTQNLSFEVISFILPI